MTTSKWHEGRVIAFDVESTGVRPHEDRIVTAAVVHMQPGSRPRTLSWLIVPGVPVPEEAAAVHGWTDAKLAEALDGAEARYSHVARQAPMTRAGALESIASQVAFAMTSGTPLVACNAAFDLTMLDAELARHDLPTLVQRVAGHTVANVVDPQVLDKAYDPFRRVKGGCTGSKKGYNCGGCGATDKTLSGLCTHYGIVLAGAHDAGADALAAARLSVRIVQGWPDAARLKLSTLHAHQVEWRREQCDSLRAYFDRAGTEHDGVCGSWPLHRGCACSQTAAAVA